MIQKDQTTEYCTGDAGGVLLYGLTDDEVIIIDKIDKVLAKRYGFTDEELDFIINYDIKCCMGDELNEE